jgi:hypothetical protein
MRIVAAVLFAALLGTAALAAAGKSKYLVIAPHSKEECLAALDDVDQNGKGLLKKIDWGCAAGDHTGYLEVEAADEKEALANLPEKSRASARAVKLVKFTPEQIKQFHAGK